MKALVARRYGRPEDLEVVELDDPLPGAGQMLVRVAAASINATDLRVISGDLADTLPIEFPYVPGNDFAGTVIEVGEGVTAYAVGDEVFGQAMPRQLRVVASKERPSVSTGTLAELAVFEADTPMIARRPASVPPEEAAALAIGGMTARASVKTAGVAQGERVLLVGATGGVGTAAMSLLSALGAHTIATADSTVDAEALRAMGASETVPFASAGYPSDVDVVLNFALPAEAVADAARALRPGGRLVTIVVPAPTQDDLGRDDVELSFVMDLEGRLGGMPDVADVAAAGVLKATIGARYPLERGAEAMAEFAESGVLGKVVVTM